MRAQDYDLVVIGTGSAMSLVEPFLERHPGARVAVIDKDEPGGICLTRGCIPTKVLVYPAELRRLIEQAGEFGIDAEVRGVDFGKVMARMRRHVHPEIEGIREGLRAAKAQGIDYFRDTASFTAPSTLRLQRAGREVRGKTIFLCIGSEPAVPPMQGLDAADWHTTDTILGLEALPRRVCIIGGGYIAAEYGHFFGGMGSDVTVVGRNPRFLPDEEPEVSAFVHEELGKHIRIVTNHEAVAIAGKDPGPKVVRARDRATGKELRVEADCVLIAAGRAPTTRVLDAAKGGIALDANGWVVVDEHLRTSQPDVWALGDANGFHQFKHKANYEAGVLYRNAILGERVKAEYHAVPHAVFTHPEAAGVGLGEAQAVREMGEERVLVGWQRYEDTAKGFAMGARGLCKVLVERGTGRILGAHVAGPFASTLVQEVVLCMQARATADMVLDAMHIHPALSEVVERAFGNLMSVPDYRALGGHRHAH